MQFLLFAPVLFIIAGFTSLASILIYAPYAIKKNNWDADEYFAILYLLTVIAIVVMVIYLS